MRIGGNMKPNLLTEKWECVSCGNPCRVEIVYSDDKIPEYLKKNHPRFRNRICLCKENRLPNWEQITS